MLKVPPRARGVREEPLQDLFIGILLPLAVRFLALPDGLLVESHELGGRILEEVLRQNW
jgi:hypothetical protein